MTENSVFPVGQVEHLRLVLTEQEFGVLVKAMARLETVVRQVKEKGLVFFACHPGLGSPALPLQMRFHHLYGNSMAKSISLKREWEAHANTPYTAVEAFKMNEVITTLVMSLDEMRSATRARYKAWE